jgi:hypothetical protein
MSTYFLKKNLAELMRRPSDQGATPTADRMVAQTAAGVARRNASLTSASRNRQLRKVQFDRNVDLRKSRLDQVGQRLDMRSADAETEKKQGRLALAIGAGNIGVTAGGGYAAAKRQDRQDALIDRYLKTQQSMLEMQQAFTKKYLTLSQGGTT